MEMEDHVCVGVPVGYPRERLESVGKGIEGGVNRGVGWEVVVAGSGRRWGFQGIRGVERGLSWAQ